MNRVNPTLRACGFMQVVRGAAKNLRLSGAILDPGQAKERWIITGVAGSVSADHRLVVTSDGIYGVADYVSKLSASRRALAVWQLWCCTRSLPDSIEWLRPDGSIANTWIRRQLAAVVRAELEDRERIRRAIDDALGGDGRDLW
jgi:hypothetical protein